MVGSSPDRVKPKDYNIGICCFLAKHAKLKRKSKDGLAQNQDNVFESGAMSLLFQWVSTVKNPTTGKHVGLVKNGPHHCLIKN